MTIEQATRDVVEAAKAIRHSFYVEQREDFQGLRTAVDAYNRAAESSPPPAETPTTPAVDLDAIQDAAWQKFKQDLDENPPPDYGGGMTDAHCWHRGWDAAVDALRSTARADDWQPLVIPVVAGTTFTTPAAGTPSVEWRPMQHPNHGGLWLCVSRDAQFCVYFNESVQAVAVCKVLNESEQLRTALADAQAKLERLPGEIRAIETDLDAAPRHLDHNEACAWVCGYGAGIRRVGSLVSAAAAGEGSNAK